MRYMSRQTRAKCDSSDELATRLAARTNRILIASGAMFLIWQLAYFVVFTPPPGPPRSVDVVRALALVAWCGALLMLLATGGGAFRAREVREILDDELARAHRAQAYQNAFWALMALGLAAYVAAQFTVIDGRLLAHAIVSAGVLVAVATGAYLNRR
jgi:hypothetical protein